MRDINESRQDLLASHGTALHMFINGPAGRALRQHLIENGPQIRIGILTDAEITQFGPNYVSRQQGWNEVMIELFEALAGDQQAYREPEASYLPDDFMGGVGDVPSAEPVESKPVAPRKRKK